MGPSMEERWERVVFATLLALNYVVGGIIDDLGFCSPYISLVLTMAVSSGVVKRLLKDYYLYETI